jgi:putative transcriptional regulator
MRQRDVAEVLGITIQAVSKHLKRLLAQGLVALNGVEYVLTPEGIERLTAYTRFVEAQTRKASSCLRLERLWPAIAQKPISAGEKIGLVMKNGQICAVGKNHKDAKAFGIAKINASMGEEVALRDLSGIVNLRQGTVMILRFPSINQGGSRNVDMAKVRKTYMKFNPDKIGVMGTVARVVANKLRLRIDFEFGVTRSAAMAALRGLNILVLSTGRMTNRVLEEIEKVNIRHSCEIPYTVEDCQLSSSSRQNSLAESIIEAE